MPSFARWPRPGVSVGLEIVPPTLMIAVGHPLLGCAALGCILALSTLQSVILVRSAQARHRAILTYAQDTTNMGGDPSAVIAALREHGGDYDDVSLPPWPGRHPEP